MINLGDTGFEENENQTMKIESFSNEDSEGDYISVRWFSTFEQMIKKDFGEYSLTPLSQHKNSKIIIYIIL